MDERPTGQTWWVSVEHWIVCCVFRTAAVQHKAAFSVARGTYEFPDKASVIRFTTEITNINGDYSAETGRFR